MRRYIRQAIVNPNSMPLPNYPPIMPTFQGQVNEEQVLQLIAYVKSLGAEERKTSGNEHHGHRSAWTGLRPNRASII